jgi:hypothetical protein
MCKTANKILGVFTVFRQDQESQYRLITRRWKPFLPLLNAIETELIVVNLTYNMYIVLYKVCYGYLFLKDTHSLVTLFYCNRCCNDVYKDSIQ